MNKDIRLSVVLPCYNGGVLLRAQLDALAAQEWEEPWELLFLDNGSTDGSAVMAKEFENRIPNLRIIDASAERGQPYALNLGIELAQGSLILTCDADDEVAPGWLKAMAEALKEHRFVASRVDHVKLNPPWLHWNQQSEVLPSLWYHPHLPYAAGATLGFRKSLFEKIGRFDPELPYLHDTEFCIQAQLQGVTIVLVKGALLHYRRRSSLRGHFAQSRNYAAYNTLLAKRYLLPGQSNFPLYQQIAKDWVKLLRLMPRARSRHMRFEIAWMLGRQFGRVAGCLKFKGIPV